MAKLLIKNTKMKAKITLLALAIHCVVFPSESNARKYYFSASSIGEKGKNVDLSLFNEGVQLPGTYYVDIILNGKHLDSRDVDFQLRKGIEDNKLYPCLSLTDLSRYGVKVDKYPALGKDDSCSELSVIEGATFEFNFYNQQLYLNIPQASLRPPIKGIAPRELWDDGIPVFLMNYRGNTLKTEHLNSSYRNKKNDVSSLQLNPGINFGPWRLRSQFNRHTGTYGDKSWQHMYTYAERGFYDLQSTLTLGDKFTPSDVFDSVSFRGGMLSSDDDMVPYYQRAYAPVVRGIARTQASIEVRQRGYTIYSGTVAPGAFELTDLTLGGGTAGDLEVTVLEADGEKQIFTIPFQTPALALKEGYFKYNIMSGKYLQYGKDSADAAVAQGTLIYGLPFDMTVYGGAQASDNYKAAVIGLGWSLGDYGAISADLTGSSAHPVESSEESGVAWRGRYSKQIIATDTTLSIAGYRYATPGFMTLGTFMSTQRNNTGNTFGNSNQASSRIKSSTSVSLSQTMNTLGSLGLNFSRSDYWNDAASNVSYGVSYGVSLPLGISATLSMTESQSVKLNGEKVKDRLSGLWFSMPLSNWLTDNTYSSYQFTGSSKRGNSHSAGLYGSAFDRKLTWDVRHSQNSGSDLTDKQYNYLRLGWNGAYGIAGGSYNSSSSIRQSSANVSGSMVIHEKGLTLGQPLGNTVVLLDAPGASGVPFNGTPGQSTDFRGFATSSTVRPYQENIISLDPLALGESVEITQTDVKVIPTKGAVIPAKFKTRAGSKALMKIKRGNQYIPFGALVTVHGREGSAGIAGREGQVYLTGLPEVGKLNVAWSEGNCSVDYKLPLSKKQSGVDVLLGECI